MKFLKLLVLSPYGYILLHLFVNLLIYSALKDYFMGDKTQFDDKNFWESGVNWLNYGGWGGIILALISIFLLYRAGKWWEIFLVSTLLVFPLLLFSVFCWYSYALLFGIV